LGRDPAFREMDWRVEMRAGMLDDAPPVEIETILLDVELLLELNPRHTEEGREVGRHGVSEIDRAAKSPWRSVNRVRRGYRCKRSGRRSLEEPPPRETPLQRLVHHLLASWNAHDDPPPLAAGTPNDGRRLCPVQHRMLRRAARSAK